MIKQLATSLALVSTLALLTLPAHAQPQFVQGKTGDFGRSSHKTNNYRFPNSANTMNQRLPRVPQAGLGGLAPIFGGGGRNGLPNTSMDSFVLNAGGSADQIYGDEGTDGPPPFSEFTTEHRINTGIQGQRAAGLTTGHGSMMPDAWGGDEFCKGPEWSMSGSGSNSGPVWARPGMYAGNGMRNLAPTQGGVNLNAAGEVGPQGQVLNGSPNQASQAMVGQNQGLVQNNQGSNSNPLIGFNSGSNTPLGNQFGGMLGPGSMTPTGNQFGGMLGPGSMTPTGNQFGGMLGPGSTTPTGNQFGGSLGPGATTPTGNQFGGSLGPGATTPTGSQFGGSLGPGATTPTGNQFGGSLGPGATTPTGSQFGGSLGPGATTPTGNQFGGSLGPGATTPTGSQFGGSLGPGATTIGANQYGSGSGF